MLDPSRIRWNAACIFDVAEHCCIVHVLSVGTFIPHDPRVTTLPGYMAFMQTGFVPCIEQDRT